MSFDSYKVKRSKNWSTRVKVFEVTPLERNDLEIMEQSNQSC